MGGQLCIFSPYILLCKAKQSCTLKPKQGPLLVVPIGYASLAENMARSGEISRIWGPSIIAHNTTRRSHGQDLLCVWLQPSFRRGERFVFPLPYPCYTTWALGKTVQVKFLMIDTINLDMNDPGKRKTRPDSTEFSLFFL